MKRNIIALVIVMATVTLALGTRDSAARQGAELAEARVNHVGVVVRDIDAALQMYVRVMGVAMPEVNTYPIPVPDGRTAEFKVATVYMPNFHIEVIQPVNAVGPYHDHLQAYGMSIQHVGVEVPGTGSVDDLRAEMERQGGRWTLGASGNSFAYVNFHATLGTTLEVIRAGAPPAAAPPAGDALPPLAALNVSHVGFAVTDAAATAARFGDVLGTSVPTVIEYTDAQYPPDTQWSSSAYLRLAFWSQGGMGLELIESVGAPTPWSEFVTRQNGSAAQHLAIDVGNRMDEMIADLVAKGGTWTNGKPGGTYAYLDFMDTLGLVFELNGTSKSAAVAKTGRQLLKVATGTNGVRARPRTLSVGGKQFVALLEGAPVRALALP